MDRGENSFPLFRRFAALPLVLLILALGAVSQESAAVAEQSFELKAQPRLLLSRLQSGWLEWLTAVNADDPARAQEAIETLRAYVLQVEMARLPELSIAASVKAVEAAVGGDFERASWILEGAEQLDPGRPETSFAAARVHWLRNAYGTAVAQQLRGYFRTLRMPLQRHVMVHAGVAWLVTVLALSLSAFVALQMMSRGGPLYRDLVAFLGRYLPPALAHSLTWLVLIWPLVLPGGVFWLALYWTALLWTYAGWPERAIFVLCWLLLAVAPWVRSEQQRRLEEAVASEPAAVEMAFRGRLEGNLLNDLASLRQLVPDHVAVKHALADVHRKLGQCELGRPLYAEVLESEQQNAAALSDLAVCMFVGGDYERSIERFQSASEIDGSRAEVLFNLSQAYLELYRFGDSESALRASRDIDSRRVNEWMRGGDPRRLIALDGGLARADEIRRQLPESSEAAMRERGQPWVRSLLIPLALAFAALGVGVHSLPRAAPRRGSGALQRWFPGVADLARCVLLPGCSEAENGHSGRALLAVTVFVALLTLPWLDDLGFRIPWGYDPGDGLCRIVSVVGLLMLFGLRLRSQRSKYF